jgi:hypothetical protein
MVLPLPQNTCCIAAHSASAQVMMTAEAFGKFPCDVAGNPGAVFPTAAKFTAGSGGASVSAKRAADSLACCKVMPKRAFGLWPFAIGDQPLAQPVEPHRSILRDEPVACRDELDRFERSQVAPNALMH